MFRTKLAFITSFTLSLATGCVIDETDTIDDTTVVRGDEDPRTRDEQPDDNGCRLVKNDGVDCPLE